jgi:Dolichyl-phosphate-mannose-protein mannosyltransferase
LAAAPGSLARSEDRAKTLLPFLGGWKSIALLAVVYLSFVLTFSLLTRAYEADDENAHITYIEFVYRHDSIPSISASNGAESHQPPLYYFLAAGWQHLLGIPAFTPDAVPAKNPFVPGKLVFSHQYTASQHRQAVYVHEMRMLSVLLGLGTVLLTYAGARVIGLREPMAVSSGLFVALLPRELVVSGNVTSDALLFPLCALAVLLFLLSERARKTHRLRHRRLHLFGMGLVLGAAAITKFTSLPIAALLLLLTLIPALKVQRSSDPSSRDALDGSSLGMRVDPRPLVDGLIAALAFLAVSGWWFVRNKHLYGQFLAENKSNSYLVGSHPTPFNLHLLFVTLPHALYETTWYAQPNLLLPAWMNWALAVLGLLCLATGASEVLARRPRTFTPLTRLSGVALIGCILAGVAAVFIVMMSGSSLYLAQLFGHGSDFGDARVAFVALLAFGIVEVVGASNLVSCFTSRSELLRFLLWPTVLFLVDIYVLCRFLIPLGGL